MRWEILATALIAAGCGGGPASYGQWPDPQSVFPYVYTPEEGLPDWAQVRYETETWDPALDWDITAKYMTKSLNHRRGAPVESLAHFDAMRAELPGLGAGTRISFLGDLLYMGDNWEAFADPAAGLLDGELRVGNLETPTSPQHPVGMEIQGEPTFNSPVQMLDGLPLDVLQLNNNHSLDMGNDGLEGTLAEVQNRGYETTGVDTHAVVEVGDRRIALLSYTWGINRRDLAPNRELFIVPFGHLDEQIDLTSLERDVAAARAQADSVVVLVHWGFEYEYYPDPHFMILGRRMVAAGADLVVGQGPHVVQPAELCHVNRPEHVPGIGTCSVRDASGEARTAAIVYSLGNFSTFQSPPGLRSGMVATVSLDPDVTGLGWASTWMRFDPLHEVVPLEDAALDDADAAAESERLDVHLGTGWKR